MYYCQTTLDVLVGKNVLVLFLCGWIHDSTKDMIFAPKRSTSLSPPLKLNNTIVERVYQHKHLGLWLSSDLDWEKHINYTCLRANRKMAVLRSVRFLNRSTLDLLYKLTVRSVIEYALVVFYNSLKQTQMKRLDQIQYRAAKLCTGALHFTSQTKLEDDLSWESIHDSYHKI